MTAKPESPEATLEARVSGRVQGVGFRYFVYGEARRLKLAGNVRNLPDGSVRVQARGPRAKLDALVARLQRGPALARVEDVQLHWGADVPQEENFRIQD